MRKDMKSIRNDEAVSPVIGTILMVAITVILAAVIAAFVFGMGTPTTAPQASLTISATSASADTINITHRGGDAIDLGKVKAVITQGSNRMVIDALNSVTGTSFFQVGDEIGIWVNSSAGTANVTTKNKVSVTSSGTISTPLVSTNLTTGTVTVTLIDADSAKEIAKITATVSS